MYTIGSDPEFFVQKDTIRVTPAFKIIPQGKDAPRDLEGGYSMFYDNVTLEGNIPPAESLEEFVMNIRRLKLKMNLVLGTFKCKVIESSSELLFFKELEDKRANEFGCEPFYNAWTFQEEVAPAIKERFRVAGFHIHVGYENDTEFPNELVNFAIARAFDYFVIYPSEYIDPDNRRGDTYGGFGKFRHKPYGLELRSLGGFFLQDKYLKWVYNQTIKAVDFVLKNDNVRNLLDLEKSDLTVNSALNKLNIVTVEQAVRSERILLEPQKLLVT